MLSFQRAIFIKELLDKLEYWMRPETKALFYKDLNTNPTIPDMGIERNADGYFYLSDELISYCNLRNGHIVRIRKRWNLLDWSCYTQLYHKGLETAKFRIDIPIHREEILIDNHVWEYAELRSPGSDYGQNFNNDIFQWPELINGITPNPNIDDTLRDSVAAYYNNFIDQAFNIMSAAASIAEKNNVGLPSNLAYSSTRFKDSTGYFWSDFDQTQWTTKKPFFVEHSIEMLEGSLNFVKVCGVLDNSRVNNCLTYARSKWITI